MVEFEIDGEYIELFKLLKAAALVASGGEAKNLIAGGDVRVDGEVETRKRKKLYPGAEVDFFGEIIRVKKKD